MDYQPNTITKKREICMVIAGSVDSGKSSLIGVLTTGEFDDGKGKAREKIARHKHEIESGKTSDISVRNLEIKNNKIILVDLCGHEKYLKTTLYGITGYFPDYGILIVSANRDDLNKMKMMREHLGILLYMKIPFIIIITRVDIAPINIYNDTVVSLKRILKKFNKKVIDFNNLDNINLDSKELREKEQSIYNDIEDCCYQMRTNSNIIPMISISNKTGYYIEPLKHLLDNLETRTTWETNSEFNIPIFYIEEKFTPQGIGLVVSGIARKNITKGSMMLGPVDKTFIPINIWSIHDNDANPIDQLNNGQRGCIAFRIKDKKIEFGKDNIKKGMVITTQEAINKICYEFTAIIKIFNHSTTISKKYIPVIHCGTIRQSALIILKNDQILKIGDEEEVKFRFLFHPELIEPNMIFFFREGTTKGVGHVKSILPFVNDPNKNPAII